MLYDKPQLEFAEDIDSGRQLANSVAYLESLPYWQCAKVSKRVKVLLDDYSQRASNASHLKMWRKSATV